MSSLLIVSADPKTVSEIEALASQTKLRSRAVTELSTAEEWLSMHSCSALFVDARFGIEPALSLIRLAWKHHPLLVGGVVDFYQTIEDEWSILAAGALPFSGLKAHQQVLHVIQNLSGDSVDHNKFPILVVEDLDSPRDIVCSYIESFGFPNVHGVSSVAEALHSLRKNPSYYSCVVTDINMPKQSGIELIKEIRRDPELHFLPIIVLTAYATAGNLVEAITAGASGFLVKPPTKKRLHHELERAKRIFFNRMNPRLCRPEEAPLIEAALQKSGVI